MGAEDRWPKLVVQHARLLTSTLLENLLFEEPERFSSSPEQKRERAERLLEDIGLSGFERSLHEPVLHLPLYVQRLVSIARMAATNPPLLCVDEPTNGVNEEHAGAVIDYLQRQAQRRGVMVVLHNQKEMRRLGGFLVLLAGGAIQEAQPVSQFFAHPTSRAGREFIESGSCSGISSDEVADEPFETQEATAPERPYVPSAALGPNGFVWLLPGRLAGTPQPGIVFDLDYDLEALQRVGVTVLISLTERAPDEVSQRRFGIASLWHPVRDMEAPSIERAKQICGQIDQLLGAQETVAIHCKAGLGRTGTMLAACLIWRGASALSALETARRCESRWVQSDAQIRFLEEFSRETRAAAAGPGAVSVGASDL
jgi:atypical dual specificity phosphatase